MMWELEGGWNSIRVIKLNQIAVRRFPPLKHSSNAANLHPGEADGAVDGDCTEWGGGETVLTAEGSSPGSYFGPNHAIPITPNILPGRSRRANKKKCVCHCRHSRSTDSTSNTLQWELEVGIIPLLAAFPSDEPKPWAGFSRAQTSLSSSSLSPDTGRV